MNQKIYEKNIEAYKKRYGKEYEPIENNKYEGKLEDTKDNKKTIQLEKENIKLYIHSKYNVTRECKKYIEQFENLKYGTTIFVFGFGLSYYIEDLYKLVKSRADIVIYENDKELFDVTMKNIDISNLLIKENIYIFFELNKLKFLNAKNDNFINSILPVYSKLYEKEFKNFLERIKELILDKLIDKNTVSKYKYLWFEVEIENLKSLQNSYNLADFKDCFKDKPIVVVSAGPSLNKNVNLLKQIQGKVCILCAFSAAKVLEKEGIKPDFLTSIDSLQYGLSEYESNIPLIISNNGNKNLIKEHRAQKLIYIPYSIPLILLRDKLISDNLKDLNKYGIGGDVSYFSTMIAKFLGASTIILIGQDYSWVDNENAHAKGTVHKKTDYYKHYHSGTMEKQDVNGNKVYTNEVFFNFKQNMDNLNKEFLIVDNVKLIQASEGGLPIEESEVLTLQQAIDKYCIDNFCDIENIKKHAFEENKVIGTNIKQGLIEKRLEENYNKLKDCKELSEDAINIVNDILEEYKKDSKSIKKIKNLFKKVKRINKKLISNEIYYYTLERYNDICDNYYDIEESGDELLDNILFNIKYYNDSQDIINKTLDIMKKYVEKGLEEKENNE